MSVSSLALYAVLALTLAALLVRPVRLFLLATFTVTIDLCCPGLKSELPCFPSRQSGKVVAAKTSKQSLVMQTAQALAMSGMAVPETPAAKLQDGVTEETPTVVIEAVDRARGQEANETALVEAKQLELQGASADWLNSMNALVVESGAIIESPPPQTPANPVARLAGAVADGASTALSSIGKSPRDESKMMV